MKYIPKIARKLGLPLIANVFIFSGCVSTNIADKKDQKIVFNSIPQDIEGIVTEERYIPLHQPSKRERCHDFFPSVYNLTVQTINGPISLSVKDYYNLETGQEITKEDLNARIDSGTKVSIRKVPLNDKARNYQVDASQVEIQ